MSTIAGAGAWAPRTSTPGVPLPAVAGVWPRTSASPARWGLYVFVFTIPFEWPAHTIPVDVPTLGAAAFVLSTLLDPKRCYGRLPAPLWFFLVYFWVFAATFTIGGGDYRADFIRQAVVLTEHLLVFVAAYNLLRDETIARRTLAVFALACVSLALLQLSGIVSPVPDEVAGSLKRGKALGQNANRAARIMGMGILVLLGLTYGRTRSVLRPRLLVLPLVGALATAALQGGSRGGLLVLAVGLWAFTLGGRSLAVRLRNGGLVLVGVVALATAAATLPLMRARIEKAQSGDLAGREEIFPAAWGMFLEQPLLGWGPTANKHELALRVPQHGYERRDTHNLGLELLTSTGLVGTIPFLTALALCLLAAWRARGGPQGILPFAMTLGLLAGNMAGNYLAFKLQWLVLAYAVASEAQMRMAGRDASSRHM